MKKNKTGFYLACFLFFNKYAEQYIIAPIVFAIISVIVSNKLLFWVVNPKIWSIENSYISHKRPHVHEKQNTIKIINACVTLLISMLFLLKKNLIIGKANTDPKNPKNKWSQKSKLGNIEYKFKIVPKNIDIKICICKIFISKLKKLILENFINNMETIVAASKDMPPYNKSLFDFINDSIKTIVDKIKFINSNIVNLLLFLFT